MTIVARDPVKLKEAKEEISKVCITSIQRIVAISCESILVQLLSTSIVPTNLQYM